MPRGENNLAGYPRMKAMLKATGVLAICIDHRELFRLGQALDEIFGEKNRLAIINWQKSAAPRPDNNHVSTSTEYVLVYAKDAALAESRSLARTASDNTRYGNPDNDPNDLWREGNLTARSYSAKDDYAIQSPFTGELHYPAGEGVILCSPVYWIGYSWTAPLTAMRDTVSRFTERGAAASVSHTGMRFG